MIDRNFVRVQKLRPYDPTKLWRADVLYGDGCWWFLLGQATGSVRTRNAYIRKGMLHGKVTDLLVHHPILVFTRGPRPLPIVAQDVHLNSGRKNVNSRLDRVKDWRALARETKYQVCALAKTCRVSERQLRRFILERFRKRAKRWLDELRAEAAQNDFERGEPVKAASTDVQFNHASNFTRFAKRVMGETPQNLIHQISMSGIDKERPKKVTDVRFR